MGRRRIFISHAFKHVADYASLLGRFDAYGYEVYNHSIPFWDPVDARGRELAQVIEQKIRGCDTVMVLVTQGIHNSEWIKYEMQLAKRYGKRVVGVWRHGEKGSIPIPDLLDEQLYRMVGWNGPALIRAIEGEYPPDVRVFDIAEVADRERLARMLVSGASLAALVLIGAKDVWMGWLNSALRPRGLSVVLEPLPTGPGVTGPALLGALLGGLLSAFTENPQKNATTFALAGGAIGAGIGVVSSYRLRITRSSATQVIDVTFEAAE